ncbi:hypothetical protein [Streptomyces sp. CNQ-509]|uniref:hypothetical protein n=1 Tax=Streptomyces sp. CNQ-509 TaxID=444103 RepID=UPI00119FF3BE|nr:hypothetical protein [Streptomyces sp. CNQ-509]
MKEDFVPSLRKLSALAPVSCAALVLTLALPGTASAAAPTPDPDGEHCVLVLGESDEETVCFATAEESTRYMSVKQLRNLVTVYDWVGFNDSGPTTAVASTDYAVCTDSTGDIDWARQTLYGKQFVMRNPDGVSENDAYSSVQTFNGCDIRLSDWVNNNVDGGRSAWINSCSNLNGSGEGDCPTVNNWNNRASSWQLS